MTSGHEHSEAVFVFGSNLAGIHGAGAAQVAYRAHGARWGKGFGHYGNSYAVPTKDEEIQSLPLETVRKHVDIFLEYAKLRPCLSFRVTRIGCGLAGFKDEDIAPLFQNASPNCSFDSAWASWLPGKTFWGTY